MNPILKDVIMILSGIVGGTLLVLLKNKLFNKAKQEIVKVIPEEDKAKLKELFDKGLVPEKVYKDVCSVPTATECFDKTKAIDGLTNIKSPVLWMKDIASLFNLRKLIIIGVIIAAIWGYGYYKGKINKPVQLAIDENVEFTINVPNSDLALYHPKHSTKLQWINADTGRVISEVKVADIPELKKLLRPYGFTLDPVFVAGGSFSNTGAGFEGGVGLRYFKYFKWVADVCVTNKGIYPFGVSYKLTDNTAIGLSAGTGYKEGERGFFERFLAKITIKF